MDQSPDRKSDSAPVDRARRRFLTVAAGASVASVGTLAVAAALPVALPAAAAAEPDPIFAVIERHRELSASCDAAVSISGSMPGDEPEFEAADAITGERQDLLIDHANTLISSEPTTLAGIAALMRYVASLDEWQEPVDHGRWETSDGTTITWHQTFLSTLAGALDRVVAQMVEG